jgi:hypothetical protein
MNIFFTRGISRFRFLKKTGMKVKRLSGTSDKKSSYFFIPNPKDQYLPTYFVGTRISISYDDRELALMIKK